MKIAFLCNPSEKRIKDFPNFVAKIQETDTADHQVFLVDKNDPYSSENHLKKIINSKFDRIVIAGGDGTINRVINALQYNNRLTHYPIGIVPFGTCNDFARNMGSEFKRLLNSVSGFSKSETKKVVIAKINETYFINNAGFGRKNPEIKFKPLLKVIHEMEPIQLKAEWSEGKLEGNFYMMLCANAPYFSGGLHFSKQSDPSEHILDFYFVKKSLKIKMALNLLFGKAKIPLNNLVARDSILHVRSPMLQLETEKPISMILDGEANPNLAMIQKATFQIDGYCSFMVP